MNILKLRKRWNIVYAIFFAFAILLPSYSCTRREPGGVVGDTTKVIDTSSPVSIGQKKIKIYIENSGSMDGFVKGLTAFKNDIGTLLTDVKYHYGEENTKIYFIHNDSQEKLETVPISVADLTDIADCLAIEWKKVKRGSNTKLNNIFKEILNRTDDSTVSILISDCIYSIGKGGNTIDLLNQEKTTTKDAFLTKSKKSNMKLATSIYRMTSKFSGEYYPYTGDASHYPVNGKLPYFICLFASNDAMNEFCSKVQIDKNSDFEGYDNKYAIAHSDIGKTNWTVLPLTNKKGRFKTTREQGQNMIHGMEKVEYDRTGIFSFCVAVDMSGVNVQEDYLLDTSNYRLDNSKYVITSIVPFNKDEINPSDLARLNNCSPTHIITFETTGTSVGDLKVSLERKMPQWIERYNIMDDTKPAAIKAGGTFGLRFWVEGISRAYETMFPGDDSYFSFKITIKK